MAKIYEFTVEGRGPFPLDMLRYDSCWPASRDAVVNMEDTRDMRQVRLRSYNQPTLARWNSFCWGVERHR